MRRPGSTLFETVREDFRTYADFYGRPIRGRRWWYRRIVGLRMLWTSETLGGLLVLRIRDWLHSHWLGLLAPVLDRLLVARWGFSIGPGVRLAPGVYIPHPFVVAHGMVEVGSGTVVSPWVTLGLINSRDGTLSLQGPRIGASVYIGAGAQILGPVTVGDGARIGANAVVLADVPAGATAVGSPARILDHVTPSPRPMRAVPGA